MCIQGFRGQGYSAPFVANLARLTGKLVENPGLEVQLVAGADDICCFCPHLKAGVCLRAEDHVNKLDNRVLRRLGLSVNDALPWSRLMTTIASKVGAGDIDNLCGDCRWKSLTYCTEGLARLAEQKPAARG